MFLGDDFGGRPVNLVRSGVGGLRLDHTFGFVSTAGSARSESSVVVSLTLADAAGGSLPVSVSQPVCLTESGTLYSPCSVPQEWFGARIASVGATAGALFPFVVEIRSNFRGFPVIDSGGRLLSEVPHFVLAFNVSGSSGRGQQVELPLSVAPSSGSTGGEAFPSSAPSKAPLTRVSVSPTPSRLPSPSKTPKSTSSPGASPTVTPSVTPTAAPALQVFPRDVSWVYVLDSGLESFKERQVAVLSSGGIGWEVAPGRSGGGVDWLNVTMLRRPTADNVIQLRLSAAGLSAGTYRRTLLVQPTYRSLLDDAFVVEGHADPERPTLESILPQTISVRLTVLSPSPLVFPPLLIATLAPRKEQTQSFTITNDGGGMLQFVAESSRGHFPDWLDLVEGNAYGRQSGVLLPQSSLVVKVRIGGTLRLGFHRHFIVVRTSGQRGPVEVLVEVLLQVSSVAVTPFRPEASIQAGRRGSLRLQLSSLLATGRSLVTVAQHESPVSNATVAEGVTYPFEASSAGTSSAWLHVLGEASFELEPSSATAVVLDVRHRIPDRNSLQCSVPELHGDSFGMAARPPGTRDVFYPYMSPLNSSAMPNLTPGVLISSGRSTFELCSPPGDYVGLLKVQVAVWSEALGTFESEPMRTIPVYLSVLAGHGSSHQSSMDAESHHLLRSSLSESMQSRGVGSSAVARRTSASARSLAGATVHVPGTARDDPARIVIQVRDRQLGLPGVPAKTSVQLLSHNVAGAALARVSQAGG